MKNTLVLFSGSSHLHFTQHIAQELQIPVGKMTFRDFPDGERCVEIAENVRGKDIFVVQSIAKKPSFYLMELLMIVDALKRASAQSITAIIPYFGYARQDRKSHGREPISAKLVADLLQVAGVYRVLTMDLHAPHIQGFFNIPVDHLSARPLFTQEIQKWAIEDLVIVSPDIGTNKLAGCFAENLHCDLAIVDKRRIDANHVVANALIGDVHNKNVVIVDDISSTGKTLLHAADLCHQKGAKDVYVAVTHAFEMEKVLQEPAIKKVIVTDTIEQKTENNKEIISVAPLFAEAISNIVYSGSISSLE